MFLTLQKEGGVLIRGGVLVRGNTVNVLCLVMSGVR